MSGGVFAVSRELFDHEFFAPEPFSEREAWIWLIGEASWKERSVRVGSTVVNLRRGQCAYSVRFLADKWQWSKSRVARFLERLSRCSMIGTAAGQGVTVITICKYNEYQKVGKPEESESGTAAGQQRDSSGTKRETGETREEGNIPLRGPQVAASEVEVYSFGKSVLGKSAGGVITKLRKACEFDDAHAVEWLTKASEKENPMEWMQAVLRATADRVYRGVLGAPQHDAPAIVPKAERTPADWRDDPIYRNVQ